MSKSASRRAPTGNLFLDHLPRAPFDRLQPALVPVSLKSNDLINDDSKPMERVFFPVDSVISVVLDMSDGDTAEVGFIGREGMTGLSVALGQPSVNQRSIVQIPNGALYLSIEDFEEAVQSEPELKAHSLRYAQAALVMAGRLAACNALHPTTERCARWLLMAFDRVGADVLHLTQEFLGQMLGVRRASVALAAKELQGAGLIAYKRARIEILDRQGLEEIACECYGAMTEEWVKTMGYALRDGRRAAAH